MSSSSLDSAASGFKVIVVGGGPSGLVAAHALYLAGIDFVILERRQQILEDSGASVVLTPGSVKLLHQLGLKDRLNEIGTEFARHQSYMTDGRKFKDTTGLRVYKERLGVSMTIVHRADLCRILYEELPESIKAKVIPAKQVQQLDQTDDAVTATCADGSQYIGTIVIGADGVYSQTRRQMREAALRADPSAEWDQEEPFEAAYKCLWCSFPRPEKAQVGLGTDTQDHDRSTMFLSGKDRGWIFLYEKLDSPTRQRNRYTTEDIEAYASRFYDMPVTESIKVRDVFTAKTAGMSNLGEGVIKNWSMGRFVLVGDAIHKFTPNAGLGLNSGIQDVVALCNQLKTLVARPSKGPYTVAQVSKAFEAYRSARLSYWQTELAQSVFVSRLHAWPSVWRKMSSRYIFNRKIVEYLALRFVAVRKARKSLLLDYSPVVEPIAAH